MFWVTDLVINPCAFSYHFPVALQCVGVFSSEPSIVISRTLLFVVWAEKSLIVVWLTAFIGKRDTYFALFFFLEAIFSSCATLFKSYFLFVFKTKLAHHDMQVRT